MLGKSATVICLIVVSNYFVSGLPVPAHDSSETELGDHRHHSNGKVLYIEMNKSIFCLLLLNRQNFALTNLPNDNKRYTTIVLEIAHLVIYNRACTILPTV